MRSCLREWITIQRSIQDVFDTPVTCITKVERPGTSRLKPLGTNCLLQAQDGLHRTQAIQRAFRQQGVNYLRGGGA